jgi:hypothetical protein
MPRLEWQELNVKRRLVLKKYENRVKIYSLFDASSCRIVSRFAIVFSVIAAFAQQPT